VSAFRDTRSRRLTALVGAALAVVAVVLTANLALALELLPAILLLGLALAGWMPGEARLVRAMRRRRAAARPRRSPASTPRRGSLVALVRDRIGASSVALRGPPRALRA
jgi:hypothetical protein